MGQKWVKMMINGRIDQRTGLTAYQHRLDRVDETVETLSMVPSSESELSRVETSGRYGTLSCDSARSATARFRYTAEFSYCTQAGS